MQLRALHADAMRKLRIQLFEDGPARLHVHGFIGFLTWVTSRGAVMLESSFWQVSKGKVPRSRTLKGARGRSFCWQLRELPGVPAMAGSGSAKLHRSFRHPDGPCSHSGVVCTHDRSVSRSRFLPSSWQAFKPRP